MKGAIADSFRLLVLEHTTRIAFQQKTRRELGGPFLNDYLRSVKVPDTWDDGDGWGVPISDTRYTAPPRVSSGWIMKMAPTIPSLAFSREYWASRGRATAWAAAYSLQFEFGFFSEASIGNVGLRPDTTGWVDHIITPAGALGFMVAEDALDRYLIARIESWTENRFVRAVSRMVLNPSRTLSTAVQARAPWSRPVRSLR